MTNEELAVKIQQGETDLYLQLWENVEKFVVMMAKRHHVLTDGRGGVEIEDLVQSGYLALVSAVNYFDASKGYSFLTFLGKRLKSEFSEAAGIRTERSRHDPLDRSLSLDCPISDEDDSITLFDYVEDPVDYEDQVIEKAWVEDLREALKKAISKIPEEQGEIIQLRYREGLSVEQTSKLKGIDGKTVRQLEGRALSSLRKPNIRGALERFVDDRTPFYLRGGVSAFKTEGTRPVEYIAIIRERLEDEYKQSIASI